MKHWGPLVTAVVVVLGLVGFMVTNSLGGLVVAAEQQEQKQTSAPAPETSEAPEAPEAPAEPEEPEGAQFPGEVVYAGTAVESKGLAIAIAVKGEDAAAYLCDGSEIEAWMTGKAVDGKISLTTDDDSAILEGSLADGELIEGEGNVNGQEFTFSLDVAEPPAGLYRGEIGDATIGWIVLPDGNQVGIASSPDGAGPAPELDPDEGAVEVGGQQVEAVPVTGDSEF